jgi:hypothetical protein
MDSNDDEQILAFKSWDNLTSTTTTKRIEINDDGVYSLDNIENTIDNNTEPDEILFAV